MSAFLGGKSRDGAMCNGKEEGKVAKENVPRIARKATKRSLPGIEKTEQKNNAKETYKGKENGSQTTDVSRR